MDDLDIDHLVQNTREEYQGLAVLRGENDDSKTAVTATVHLRGQFVPMDGRFHWFGRIDAKGSQALSSGDRVEIEIDAKVAHARLSDSDPWGRLRITGVGRPPF